MAEFNLFGNATKGQITVGYISTERGFVDNVTVCEANDYAQLNPGTQFIFKTREFTKYMNINGVNKLTPADLQPQEECKGVEMTKDCGPAQAHFSGGAGVGVKGNPVIGADGAVMAIDLVSGGFGYQSPPIVEVKDNCGIGAGGYYKSILGEVVETVEYYDQEDDFEDYEICVPEDDINFGRRYGPDGKDLGPWEPRLYANLDKDPIRREIKQYQEFLSKGTKPWWSTRKQAPLSITGEKGTTRSKFNVDHPAWGDFMNKYAISPKPASNAPGTDFAGIPYSFIWEEDFPYDGEYVFRGAKDNKAEFYLDGVFVSDLNHFSGAIKPIKKTLKAGVHKIRVDLLNIPIKEKVIVTPTPNTKDVESSTKTIVYVGLHGSNKPIRVTENNKKIELKDGDGNDTNCSLRIKSGDLKFSDDGKSLIGPGSATIEMNWNDRPSTAGVAVEKITVVGKTWTQKGRRGTETHLVTIDPPPPVVEKKKSTSSQNLETHEVFNTISHIDKANRQLWRTNVYNRGGFINQYGVCPFDTQIQLEDNPYSGTHTIIWDNVNFPIDGNYDIGMQVDDNVNLTIIGGGKEEIIYKKGFTGDNDTSTGKSDYIRSFKKGTYKIIAELEQISGGKFGFSGIKGINPMALAIDIKTVFTEKEVISAKSWNENPMGLALTIDAPEPPIPQEPIVQSPGRCPRNPMWSTRFPGAEKKWWPVNYAGWSKFFNRYALSPVAPLSDESSAGGGTVFTNSWDVEVPYSGWYKLRGEVDDIARIYIDDVLKLDLSRRKDKIRGDQKLFLVEGMRHLKMEVENYKFETFKLIDKKIFNTADWVVKSTASRQTGTVDVTFKTNSDASFANSITIKGILSESKTYKGTQINSTISSKVEIGKVYDVEVTSAQSKSGVRLRDKDGSILQMEEHTYNDLGDIQCSATQGKFYDFVNGANKATCKYIVEGKVINTGSLSGGTAKDGVTYDGPALASYNSGPLGAELSPTWIDDQDFRANNMGKEWTATWNNVDFPEDGKYDISSLADDIATIKLDGTQIAQTKHWENLKTSEFTATKGKRSLEVTFSNIPGDATSTFATNPVVFAFKITKKMNVSTGKTKSWTDNPIGISAVLIPPPCPKKVKGKGVVTEIVVDDPGNGFPRPGGDGYPATLRLKDINIKDAGINYDCSKDEVIIEPSFGAKLSLCQCSPFGQIEKVCIDDAGLGFNRWPNIRIKSPTGVNFEATPVFEVVRDPVLIDEDKLIQVTDLVGLKQTGYYQGRPYYGAVFYKDGVRYAGWYETVGELVEIYSTLQESIDAETTTPASAILKQGSDISSNDPNLNLPR